MSSSEDDQSSEDEFSDGEEDVLQAVFDAEDEEEESLKVFQSDYWKI